MLDGTSDYEVKATLTLTASGGNYTVFLRASTNAQLGSSPQGTFYAVELQNPQFSGTACTASLQLYKKFAAQVESLGLVADVPCRNGMSIRAVRRPDGLLVHLDDVYYTWVPDSGFPNPITSGKPGIGGRQMPAGNSISRVELGPLDRVRPPAVNASSIGSSLFPTRVDLQWQAVTDGSVGTQRYDWLHAGGTQRTFHCCEYSEAVNANTTYNYTVYAIDFHLNYSLPTTITVKTPQSGWIDGRRIGVRPEGSYWGGLGEQIDTRSGNLNFTKPLVKAQGRGGWGVAFALSYNSQNWRKDPGGTWKLGRDSGYGYGWRLMAGSLTPYYDSYLTPTFYLYTDATGAEYKLNSNAGGVWTSKEAVYASYDSNTGRLYFPDGSFWVFGCISAGTEEDGGTMYPTLMQDTNGNQILIRYFPATGLTWPDSSARIREIEDVRAVLDPVSQTYWTYRFTYSNEPTPHLVSIASNIGDGQNYTLAYTDYTMLQSPFDPAMQFGTRRLLGSMTGGANLTHAFEYGTGAELTKVTMPFGGMLTWVHGGFQYIGSRWMREVTHRTVTAPASQGRPLEEYQYWFWHPDEDSGRTVHGITDLHDASETALTRWGFEFDPARWDVGFLEYEESRPLPNGTYIYRATNYTWTGGGTRPPYISRSDTTLDGAVTSRQEQTVDLHGNVTERKEYDYGSLTTPKRTYNMSYKSGTPYSNRFIFNRLTSATVTQGTQTRTLVSNTYDSYTGGIVARSGLREHDSNPDGTGNYGTGLVYRGNVTSSTAYGSPIATTMKYDITGTVTQTTTGNTTVAVTPANNNAVPGVITPNSQSNLATSLQWNSFLGLTANTGPNGASVATSYDAYARPLTATSPHGAVTTYSYSNSPPTSTATVNGRWTKTKMDGLGRTIKVEAGNGTTVVSVVETKYVPCACSPLGKVSQTSEPYAPGGTVYWTTYGYDAMGRTVSVTQPSSEGGRSRMRTWRTR